MGHLLCDVCNESFNRKSSLTRHKKNFHSDLLLVNHCIKCSKTFARRDLLLRHERLHRGEGLSACKVCLREFRNDYLEKHLEKCRLKAIKYSTQSEPITSTIPNLVQIQWQNPKTVIVEPSSRNSQQTTGRRVQQPLRYVAASPLKESVTEKEQEDLVMSVAASKTVVFKDAPRRGQIRNHPQEQPDKIKLSTTAWTFLKQAYRTNNGSAAKPISETDFDFNQKDLSGRTALHWLCTSGMAEDVLELLQKVDDINSLDNDGMTPLCLAIRWRMIGVLKQLIDAGANVDINGRSSFEKPDSFPLCETPLEISAEMKDHEVIRILLDAGADPNLRGIFLPLEVAILDGYIQHAELLLGAGASIDFLEVEDISEMRQMLSLPNGQYKKLKRFGKQRQSHECVKTPGQYHTILEDDADSVSHEDLVQISLAIDEDRSDELEICLTRIVSSRVPIKALRRFCEVGREHFDGRNAIMQACWYGAVKCLRYMLLSYPDMSLSDQYGWTALHYACQAGFYVVVQILLSENEEVDYCTGQGCTPLCIAAKYGRKVIVKLLLDAGADINGGAFSWASPLYYACMYDHSETALMLLRRGANVNEGVSGATPLELAIRYGSAELTRALLSAGASIDRISEACWIELQRAEETSEAWHVWYKEASEKIRLLERALEARAQASHSEADT